MNHFHHILLIFSSLLTIPSQGQVLRQSAWQQTVNYTIDVTLDDQNHMLRGFETIEYINNSSNTIDEIYIHLWANAYKNNQTAFAKQELENGSTEYHFAKEEERGFIDSLDFFINEKGTTWSYDLLHEDIVKIVLNKPLKSGERCLITTPFRVKIPKVFSRLGHEGQTYNITQWYPKPAVYDINGWNPIPYLNQGEFYSEFGAFDVKITLPKNYIVAATGELENEDEIAFRKDKGKNTGVIENTHCKTPIKTIRFRQNNIHDFAWFASKNFGILQNSVEIGGKTIETFVYSQKPKDLNAEYMDAIKTALVYYSENSGNYPYSHATVVKSELKAGGGMEYPMITVCDILNQEVIIHEVGHNWFYGILANNERRYPWMDESINSYFEAEAMKPSLALKNQNKRQSILSNINDYSIELLAINAIRNNSAQAVGLHSMDYTNLNYGLMVYGKGALIFNHLKAYLGDDDFKKCFNTYFETWKYKHPLPGDMQDVFEKTSGKSLDWFFNSLINNNDKMDVRIKSIKTDKAGNGQIVLKNNRYITTPIPVVAYKDNATIHTFWVTGKEGTFQLPALGSPSHYVIDPDNVIFDANRKNNQYRTQGLFKKWSHPGIKPITLPDMKIKHDMFVLPLIGYNIHNGFLAGIAFHNWSVPQRKFEYMVAPLWGFKTNTINGYANFNYKVTPRKGWFQTIDIGLNNASFAYKPFAEPFTYYRTKGFVNLNLKPSSLRSSVRNYVILEYTNVEARWLEKASETADSNRVKPYFETNKAPISYGFARLTWLHDNKRTINPYSLKVSLEQGGYEKEKYFKPGLELNFLKTYKRKNKGFSIRLFTGTFISNDKNGLGLFQYRLGSKNGDFDYGMEQSLMGRGAKTGVWSSHITPGEDNMKLKGSFGEFSNGFVTINLSSNLPGKIPLRPYADIALMQGGFQFDTKKENFVYSGGVALDIIPKMFIIYFPLVQSQSIMDVQENQKIDNFGKRICFTLVLNDFEPHKLFKRIKLF